MTDVFDEINDDLRREKLNQFWKENGSWIIGGALGAVLLTGAMTAWRTWEYSRDAAATTQLARLTDAADWSKVESFAASSDKNHAMMARFMAADAYLEKHQTDKAIALYNDIAATSGLDKTWRDLARIHSLSLRLDKDPPEALAKELAALSGSKDVWRYTALEMQALLAARQGHMQDAANILASITADPQAPEDMRQRAFSLRELYIADAKASQKS
jgi:hypothetical protein